MSNAQSDVVIVGAGVTGVTNAIKLAQNGHRVRVFFDVAMQMITTWASAAFWLPVLSGKDPRIPGIAAESLKEFYTLAKNPASGVHPIRLHVCYTLAEQDPDLAWRAATPTRQLEKAELPAGCGSGYEANVFRMQMENYLPFLIKRAEWLGVSFEQRKIVDLGDIDADVVLNCTGVFARHLAKDKKVQPIRGQVVLVETPPELQNSADRDYDVLIIEGPKCLDYIVFRDNDVLLGGTADKGNWNTNVNADQTKSIISNCTRILPALREAKIIEERVGLRPYRENIRMEIERFAQRPPICHVYGHGGSGVTLSWGSATLVQAMVQRLMVEQLEIVEARSKQASFARTNRRVA